MKGTPVRRSTWSTSSTLIRIDTPDRRAGERAAAEWVAELLPDWGLAPELVESQPRCSTVVARVASSDPELAPPLIHMHLDVVPAQAHQWQVHPLSGEVNDGYLWGRGAVDMEKMVAAALTVVGDRLACGRSPRRGLVSAFFAGAPQQPKRPCPRCSL